MRRVDNEYNYPKYWYIALQLAQENKYYIYFFRNTIFGQVEILYCEGNYGVLLSWLAVQVSPHFCHSWFRCCHQTSVANDVMFLIL